MPRRRLPRPRARASRRLSAAGGHRARFRAQVFRDGFPPWLAFAVAGAVSIVAYEAIPVEGAAKDAFFYNAVGLCAIAAIVAGIRLNRPADPSPWWFFAAGELVFVIGDMFFSAQQHLAPNHQGLATASNLIYLAGYPLIAVGLLRLIRQRTPGRDWVSLIDALIFTTAPAILIWLFLMEPYVHSIDVDNVAAFLYPMMDIVLIALAMRLFVAPSRKPMAFRILGASLALLLTADIVSGLVNVGSLSNTSLLGQLVDGLFLGSYVLFGAAALHPTMAEAARSVPVADGRIGRGRLALMLAAMLVTPAALVAAYFSGGRGITLSQLLIISVGSAALLVLVMARLGGLLRRHEQSVARESVLRRAGAALVGATSRERIYEAAHAAAGSLLEDRPDARVWLTVGPADDPTIIGPDSGNDPERDLVAALYRAGITSKGSQLAQDGRVVFATPLVIQRELRGAIVTVCDGPLEPETKDGLQTLASQVALALESSQLTEDLLRRESEQRFRSLVQNSSDVITVIDPDTTIRYVTPSVTAVLGYGMDDLLGNELTGLVHPEDLTHTVAFLTEVAAQPGVHAPLELRIRRRDGSWCHVETVTNNLGDDPNVGGIVLTSRDISDRKALERQLTHQAFHDSLTSLANRALFTDRLEHALARNRGRGRPVAVLFVDLDDFKTVNDSLGHTAGDELLRAVSRRLRGCLRPGDTCARLGGDEFALLLEDVPDEAQARRVAERVANVLKPSIQLQDKEVFVRASIGIAMGDGTSGDTDELLRAADIAMYRAKSQGKGNYAIFEPSMHAEAVERLELKAELQRAVSNEEFVLEYQPIIRLKDARVVGVEALVRWSHPQRGLLSPDEFIGLAEETGLIVPLGRWVLEAACRQGREWADRWSQAPLRMSVNLSGRQLQDPGLISDVRSAIATSGLDPALLVLEITESVLMHDSEATSRRLNELKSLGLQLAIDDFGTGYSSLSYLKRFNVDILKIAKPFIDGLNAGGREETQLARAIVRLGETLGLETVAEGIELAEQHELLSQLGCGLGQGFHFSRPLGEAEIADYLRNPPQRDADDAGGGGKVIAFPG